MSSIGDGQLLGGNPVGWMRVAGLLVGRGICMMIGGWKMTLWFFTDPGILLVFGMFVLSVFWNWWLVLIAMEMVTKIMLVTYICCCPRVAIKPLKILESWNILFLKPVLSYLVLSYIRGSLLGEVLAITWFMEATLCRQRLYFFGLF